MIKIKTLSTIAAAGIVSLYAANAAAITTLTLSGPVSNPFQQTAQTPSIFAGATPTQPSGFGWEQFPSGGTNVTYDATTGTGAVDWENAATGNNVVSGPDYTVGQIIAAVGESSFFIGIDTNTTNAESEVLQLFDVRIDVTETGTAFNTEFICGNESGSACGAIAPPAANGTGWSDYLLSTVNLTGFADTALVQFRTIITGAVDGQEQLFLIAESTLPPNAIPVPAAVWLFGSGLLGLVGVARRNRKA